MEEKKKEKKGEGEEEEDGGFLQENTKELRFVAFGFNGGKSEYTEEVGQELFS